MNLVCRGIDVTWSVCLLPSTYVFLQNDGALKVVVTFECKCFSEQLSIFGMQL